MNLDDKLEETEFLYFEHPEHNPQSIKDLVEDMISNFDRNHDKVICYVTVHCISPSIQAHIHVQLPFNLGQSLSFESPIDLIFTPVSSYREVHP